MKKPRFDKIIIRLLYKLNKNVELLVDSFESEESSEISDKKSPIYIPPDIYQKICKEIKKDRIDFMGIS